MWYVFDEYKNIADKDNAPYMAGSTYVFDGVEVYCLLGSSDTDHPLFVDKNHDLSYYFAGSDYVDESEAPWAINTTNKYGYEWGGYNVEIGTATTIGSGLDNTNNLIQRGLSPSTSGWYVVWDKIKEFRQDHSANWFLPSKDELDLIYKARSNLSGVTTDSAKNPYYWSSSEYSSRQAWYQDFLSVSSQYYNSKINHSSRSRLCYTL